jgi:hypothetical protein
MSSRPSSSKLRLRLLKPKRHVHVAVHRRRGGEVVAGLIPFARAQVDLAETEVAVGDEGAHPEPLGDGQRLAIMSLAALGCCFQNSASSFEFVRAGNRRTDFREPRDQPFMMMNP